MPTLKFCNMLNVFKIEPSEGVCDGVMLKIEDVTGAKKAHKYLTRDEAKKLRDFLTEYLNDGDKTKHFSGVRTGTANAQNTAAVRTSE